MKNIFIVIVVILLSNFMLVEASLFGYGGTEDLSITTNFYTGNLTNLSGLEDVNIPNPTDNQLLQFDFATKKWTAESVEGFTELDSKAYNGTLAYLSDILGWSFYNSTNPPTEPLWSANFTLYNSSWSSTYNATYDAYNSTGLIINWSTSGYTESDPKAYNGTLALLSDILGWSYYNSTDFSIEDYSTTTAMNTAIESGNTTLYNWVVAQGYTAGGITWANAINGTLYSSSNPFNFWNDTYATFNKTYADTLYINESSLSTIYYNATAIDVITGTGAGALEDIQVYDGISYNISEDASDLELRINFSIGVGGDFNQLIIRYKSGEEDEPHKMQIQIHEPVGDSWENYGTLPENNEYNIVQFGVFDASEHIDADGIVQVRFFQDEGAPLKTHLHQFDWVTIAKGFGTPAGQEVDPESIHKDGSTMWEGNEDGNGFNSTGWDWITADTANFTTLIVGDVNIADTYYLKSNPFGYYNSTNLQTELDPLAYNGTLFLTASYNSSGLIKDWSGDYIETELDPEAYNGTLALLSDILGWSYYNSTDFDFNDYYELSNPFDYYNSTNPQTELDPLAYNGTLFLTASYNSSGLIKDWNSTGYIINWSGDYITTESDPLAYNGTLAYLSDILSWSYYNSTDFDFNDYFTKSDIVGFDYYNSTNPPTELDPEAYNGTLFLTANYNSSGLIKDWNSTNLIINWSGDYIETELDPEAYNGTLALLSDILGWSYYNSTDFSIADYYTSAQTDTAIENGNTTLYNWVVAQSYLSGTDYYTKSDVDTNITSANTTLYNWVVAQSYLTSESDSFAYNGTLAFLSDILSWSYYNSTDFDINDYLDLATLVSFDYYNSTNPQTELDSLAYNGTLFLTANYNSSGLIKDWNLTGYIKDWSGEFVETDSFAYNGTLALLSDILGWSYYNSTDFSIADYFTKSDIVGFDYYNSTNPQTELDPEAYNGTLFLTASYNASGLIKDWSGDYIETELDPLWTSNQSLYSTTAEIIAFGYYNSTDFVITDYFTKTQIENFGYYNSTDFSIADYFTSAEVLAFDYYNSTDFDINDYVDLATILGFSYYNSTDFSIGDYSTTTEMNTAIENGNTTLYDWVVAQSYLDSETDPLAYNGTLFLTASYNASGLIKDWSGEFIETELDPEAYNGTLFLTASYNASGLIKDWNSTNLIINWSGDYIETELDPEAYNGTLALLSDILGWSYYNSTDFSIEDYFTSAEVLAFDYYNSTDFDINDYVDLATILGFSYYNSTDFSIGDYSTTADILGWSYYNSTNPQTELDPLAYNGTLFLTASYNASGLIKDWSGEFIETELDPEAYNGTLAYLSDILGWGFYNSTDFSIGDYYTSAQTDTAIESGNTTLYNWVVAQSYTSGGITWANAINGTLAEMDDILSWSYYNSSDFDIADYSTTATLLGYSWYNSTDFSIGDYSTTTEMNTAIESGNTTLYNWVVAQSYTSGGIDWADAINGTLYSSSNPYGFYNSTNPSPDTQLDEDEVEAFIFDSDNTANLGMNSYNVTAVDCIIFDSGGKICSI